MSMPRAICISTPIIRSRISASPLAGAGQGLGRQEGLTRYGHSYVPLDEALSRVVIDLSGPGPGIQRRLRVRVIGSFDVDLVSEFFHGLVNHAGMTLHIDNLRGKNAHHQAETIFKAFGRALRMAVTPIRAWPAPCHRRKARCGRKGNTIAVIDYGMGNLRSVSKALEHVAGGKPVVVTADPAVVAAAAGAWFSWSGRDAGLHARTRRARPARVPCPAGGPGQAVSRYLRRRADAVRAQRRRQCPGTRRVSRQCRAFRMKDVAAQRRAPEGAAHGLERPCARCRMPVERHCRRRPFYFVHSYFVQPADPALVTGTCEYGVPFTCAVGRDNIFAVQFTPRKAPATVCNCSKTLSSGTLIRFRRAVYSPKTPMLIIPAIDLKDGQCVRLKQGLMEQATVFPKARLNRRATGLPRAPVACIWST